MKRILMSVFTLMVIMGFAFSLANAEDEKVSVSFSSKVWSRYLGSDSAVVHDEPVLQNDVFVSLANGLYFNVWHSVGLDDTDLSSNFGDELNFTLGWNGNTDKLGLDMGIIYIDGLPVFEMIQGDSLMPYIELNRGFDITDKYSLTPYIKLELLFPLNGDHSSGDILGGIKHNWQLFDRFAINQKAYLLYDNGVWGSNDGIIGGYNMDSSWKLSEKLAINPLMLKVTTSVTSLNDGRKTEMVFGTGLTFHF